MVILSVSLFGLSSCSSLTDDNGTANTPVAPSENRHSNDKNPPARIADWTDGGLMHNAILRHADDSLAVDFPNRFTTYEAYMEWLIDDVLSDYAVNVLGFDSQKETEIRAEFWDTDLEDIILTTTEFQQELAVMVYNEQITQREADFMYRWRIIRDLLTDEPKIPIVVDSLEAWKDDILNITWGEDEETIIPFMSIAYHSFDFWLNEGYDDTDPDYDGEVGMYNRAPDNWMDYADAKALIWAIENMHWGYPNRQGSWSIPECYNYAGLMSASLGQKGYLIERILN